jgi:hypothetical protein
MSHLKQSMGINFCVSFHLYMDIFPFSINVFVG